KRVSDRVAVMYLGRLCEVAPADELYRAPAHHYTAALLEAIPSPTPSPAAESGPGLAGEPPSATEPPSGCPFRTRCPRAEARCADDVRELRAVAPGPLVACHCPLVSEGRVAIAGPAAARPDGAPPAANGEV